MAIVYVDDKVHEELKVAKDVLGVSSMGAVIEVLFKVADRDKLAKVQESKISAFFDREPSLK